MSSFEYNFTDEYLEANRKLIERHIYMMNDAWEAIHCNGKVSVAQIIDKVDPQSASNSPAVLAMARRVGGESWGVVSNKDLVVGGYILFIEGASQNHRYLLPDLGLDLEQLRIYWTEQTHRVMCLAEEAIFEDRVASTRRRICDQIQSILGKGASIELHDIPRIHAQYGVFTVNNKGIITISEEDQT